MYTGKYYGLDQIFKYIFFDPADRHLSTAPVNPALVIPALPAFYHHTSVCPPPPPPQYSPHTAHRALEAGGSENNSKLGIVHIDEMSGTF